MDVVARSGPEVPNLLRLDVGGREGGCRKGWGWKLKNWQWRSIGGQRLGYSWDGRNERWQAETKRALLFEVGGTASYMGNQVPQKGGGKGKRAHGNKVLLQMEEVAPVLWTL